MRLVGVAARGRHLRDPRRSGAQRGDRAVEADHTGGDLRRKADVVAEALDQAPWAPAELRPRALECGRVRRYARAPSTPSRARAGRAACRRAAREEASSEIEALVPAGASRTRVVSALRAGQQLLERVRAVGELVQRQPEQPSRAERRQTQLQAREGALARDLASAGCAGPRGSCRASRLRRRQGEPRLRISGIPGNGSS